MLNYKGLLFTYEQYMYGDVIKWNNKKLRNSLSKIDNINDYWYRDDMVLLFIGDKISTMEISVTYDILDYVMLGVTIMSSSRLELHDD